MKSAFPIFASILLLLIGGQVYWIRRLGVWSRKLIPRKALRTWLGAAVLAVLILLFASNFGWLGRRPSSTHMTLKDALVTAPFAWWAFSSMLAFAVVIIFWVVDRIVRAAGWTYRKLRARFFERGPSDSLASPVRRRFLERTALAVSAVPFVASAYGLVYGRVDLETTQKRIGLRRLPKAFEGFRVAQLSDFHIGPFMSEEQIRKYVEVANGFKPDLIVVTGDFVTWDASTQEAIVNVLAGLKAPFGVYGCLGNHEVYTHAEDSITGLFAAKAIRILRKQSAPIRVEGDTLNLIGVDFQTRAGPRFRPKGEHFVREYLEGVEGLVLPDTVNILLTHNPNAFDRAAELGIDLSLAGHTHGGQVALEFVHRNISPSRLVTSYVKGWFRKGDAQLYVNSGIGTIGVPIRINAPPEITVFELVREA
jgi:uncharacterized protein